MPNLWSNKVCVLIQTKNFLFLFFNLLLPIKTQTWKKQKSPFNKFYISNLIFCLAWSPCLSTPWAKRGRHSDIFYQCSAPLLNSSCCYWVVIYTCALFEPGFLESKSPHISGAKPPKNFSLWILLPKCVAITKRSLVKMRKMMHVIISDLLISVCIVCNSAHDLNLSQFNWIKLNAPAEAFLGRLF